jgi:leucyl-tRNA synthetase
MVRFRDRIISLVQRCIQDNRILPSSSQSTAKDTSNTPVELKKLRKTMHKTSQQVTQNIESMHFNAAISALMVYSNAISSMLAATASKEEKILPVQMLENLLVMLSPFAPHVCEEMWSQVQVHAGTAHTGEQCSVIRTH